MKNRLYFCLSVALLVCLGLYIKTDASFLYVPADLWQRDHSIMDQGGLDALEPRILSTPADGSVFHGERNVTPGYGQVVREVWTPTKPEDYYWLKIGITATGYGEVAFTLDGNTADRTIGHWTSEPLRKADNEPYTYRKKYLTNIINEGREGFTDEIGNATVSISNKTGSAHTRSRRVVTYGNRQAALSAQASATGPGVSFVIGTSTFWKWEPGITRDVKANTYNGKYHVTINDTNIDPGSGNGSTPPTGSGSGNGSTPPTGSTPPPPPPPAPTDNTPNCQDCTSDCSSPCSCTNSGTCGGTVSTPPSGSTPPSPSYHACNVHETSVSGDHSYISSCSSSNANGTCQNSSGYYACSPHSHSYPSPPPPPEPPSPTLCPANDWTGCGNTTSDETTCGAGHKYYTCNPSAVSWHQTPRTCSRTGCNATYTDCSRGSDTKHCLGKYYYHQR